MKNTLHLTITALGLASFNLSAATLYVSLESSNPVPPFATWATAATNIQHAVDVARAGDTVLVTNGVYAVGSRGGEWNGSRVEVTNAIRLESVNGPAVTTIVGWETAALTNEFGDIVWDRGRCVYLGTNAVLSGFTLTNGHTYLREGGGVSSEPSGVVTNCVVTGKTSIYGNGGGVCGGTLYNCVLRRNASMPSHRSGGHGGGAYGSTLYNCTLTENSARRGGGGGALGRTLYNCLVTDNDSGSDGHPLA